MIDFIYIPPTYIYVYTITVVSKSPLTTSSCFVSNNNVIITQKAETRWNSVELGGRWCALRHSPWKKDNLFFFFFSFFILESYSSFHDDFAPHNDIVFPDQRVFAPRIPHPASLLSSNGRKNSTRYFPNAIPFPVDSKNNLLVSFVSKNYSLVLFQSFFFFFFLNISRKILFSTVRAINLTNENENQAVVY